MLSRVNATADTNHGPSRFAPLLEVRVLAEVASCYMYLPILKRIAPAGDGHPVMTLPPFMSDDNFMSPMRKFLDALGYETMGWDRGQNTGFEEGRFVGLADSIERIADERGRRVSLIGHSLGGIYARLLGHQCADAVRQVIYLGTPFNIGDGESRDLPIRKIYERLNPVESRSDMMQAAVDMGTTPMPSTAIYTEGDGFVPWQFCMDEVDEVTENLRVAGSHTGLPFNLPALYAIADRLAQPEDDWRPFSVNGLGHCLYGVAPARDA